MKCSTRPAAFLEPNYRGGNGLVCSVILLAALVAGESSCHKRQVQIPAAPPAPTPSAPAGAAPAPAKPTPQEMPPPPALAPAAPSSGSESVIPNPPPAPPPAPARPTRRPGRQATTPAAPTAPQTPPAAPAPQLGIVLSPDQQRQYNAAIDQSLQRAEASLKSIANRQLTDQQQASLDEARNFIRQAQATRTSDLPGARRLAERAEVLAGNLASSLH